jgi:hypothetical protein
MFILRPVGGLFDTLQTPCNTAVDAARFFWYNNAAYRQRGTATQPKE